MQINNQFGNYDSHIMENKRADGNVNIDAARQQKNLMDVSGWKEGMVFKGEVLDIVDNKVLLHLENQLNFMARLQSDMELGIGDQLLFSVKENNGNQVFIKPMFDSLYSAQTQVLEKALDMAGLSPTEKNFAVAKELMEAGLPLDRASMTNLLSQSMKFPDTSISTLVSLNKLNIPVTLDYHHHQCNSTEEPLENYLEQIFSTWKKKNIPPKIHFSSPQSKKEIRSHNNYIDSDTFISFLEILKNYSTNIDIMLEAKKKDEALFRLIRELKYKTNYHFLDETTIEI